MANTWVPRGQLTAQLLYGSEPGSGAWVVHDEMNVFGHTGMKEEAQWANYPASAAWIMQHVYDNWEYSQDDTWLAQQGYPLMSGVAEFWLGQLQEDKFSEDHTLVVNPWLVKTTAYSPQLTSKAILQNTVQPPSPAHITSSSSTNSSLPSSKQAHTFRTQTLSS